MKKKSKPQKEDHDTSENPLAYLSDFELNSLKDTIVNLQANNKKKPISASEAQARMKALCESTGIPYSQNQKSKGEASIHFINKPKKEE